MANRIVLLNLDTLVIRPIITIDGADYEMLNPGEISLLDLHRFGALGSEFDALSAAVQGEQMTEEQAAAVSAALDKMVRMILRAPEDLLSRLTDVHRYRIVEAFNMLTRSRLPETRVSTPDPGAAGAIPPTGEKS